MEKMIKVCGMTDGENIREVEALGVDFIGFIFYPRTPRCIKDAPSYLPERAGRVGVFVDASFEDIILQNEKFSFDLIQLHGCETPEFCRTLKENGLKVMKSINVSSKEDIIKTKLYCEVCDMLLFDTKTALAGGSGKPFDWTILEDYKEDTPFLLSGGLSAENVEEVKAFRHPALAGYDLNSRFEIRPGYKNIDKLKEFINKIHE